jgi:hypothetical protein
VIFIPGEPGRVTGGGNIMGEGARDGCVECTSQCQNIRGDLRHEREKREGVYEEGREESAFKRELAR